MLLQITYPQLQMYTPYSELSATFFGFNFFKELDQSLDLIYLLVLSLESSLLINLLMNVRYFHLRAAKVHTLFLITKFILKKINLFSNKLSSSPFLLIHPQITGCKCINYFLSNKKKNKNK